MNAGSERPVNNSREVEEIKRLLTALVLLPLLIFVLFAGGEILFASLAVLLSALGLDEYYRMVDPDAGASRAVPVLLGSLIPAFASGAGLDAVIVYAALAFLVTAAVMLFTFGEIRPTAPRIALFVSGWVYLPVLLSFLVVLRSMPEGKWWILILLGAVMFSDSAAFYVGTAIGRHKLYPSVSPNKSVEGSLAGVVGSVAGALILQTLLIDSIPPLHAAGAGFAAGIAGQVGDLFESMLKRSAGVKDSGSIFPGHGGVLDRLDSILFASPIVYLYAVAATGG